MPDGKLQIFAKPAGGAELGKIGRPPGKWNKIMFFFRPIRGPLASEPALSRKKEEKIIRKEPLSSKG